jgi:hypothetical protein
MTHAGNPQKVFNFYKTTNIVSYYLNILSLDENKAVEVALNCLLRIFDHG